MGTETVSRHDNTVVWEMRDDDDVVVMSTAVRTRDGETVSLTRDGSLVMREDTVLVVELAGVDPQSIVVANGFEFGADDWGRVSFVLNSDDELAVSFINDGVMNTTSHELQTPTSENFILTSYAAFLFVVMACVIAWCVPGNRQRRLRGAPT